MKTIKSFLIFFTFTALVISSTARAVTGHGEGNGGDDVGLEFQSAFVSALKIIQTKDRGLSEQIQSLDPLKALVNARILTVDTDLSVQVGATTQKCVATNDPAEAKILINRNRWHAIKDFHIKQGIALHEVLSLNGVEGTGQYPYSSQFLAYTGLSPKVILSGGVDIPSGPAVRSQGFPAGAHICSISGYQRPLIVVTTDSAGNATDAFMVKDDDYVLMVPTGWYKPYDHRLDVGQNTYQCSSRIMSAAALAKWNR